MMAGWGGKTGWLLSVYRVTLFRGCCKGCGLHILCILVYWLMSDKSSHEQHISGIVWVSVLVWG